jgi:hypothetical protein
MKSNVKRIFVVLFLLILGWMRAGHILGESPPQADGLTYREFNLGYFCYFS